MRRALKIAATIAIGIAVGLAATWVTAIRGTMSGDVSDGPWSTSLDTGTSEGGPYLRARIAVHGLLALSREETVYYSALRDSDGAGLDGNCSYRLEGRDPPTRWWSITAYGSDDFLIPNEVNLYSVSKTSVARNADGSFAATLSKDKADGNWIPIAPGRFNLTIRPLQSRLRRHRGSRACRPAHDPQGDLRMIARNWKWIVATLLIAIVVHVATLLALPRLIMMRTMSAITRLVAANTMLYLAQPTARARGVVRPSPDLLYSICIYDLAAANGALRVTTHDMPETYWSVSIFDADTNNFYALNDRKAANGAADFLLMAPGASPPNARLPVVTAPSSRGIVLFRTLIDHESRLAEIDAGRRNADCSPYKAG